MLQARFAEVSRTASNALGINLSATVMNPGNFTVTGASTPGSAGNGTTPATGSINATAIFGSVALNAAIDALKTNSLARVLAEPNLVATSGQEASFLAGGEFPIPVTQSAGLGGSGNSITVEFKEFGVRLKMTPVVLGSGRARIPATA